MNEISVVAGVGRSMLRTATGEGVVDPANLTWLDAMLLRVFATVSPTRFPGEDSQASVLVGASRGVWAVRVVREAVGANKLEGMAQLIVTRQDVRLLESLHQVHGYLLGEFGGAEPAQLLPVGRWWADLAWRLGSVVKVP